MTMPGPKTFGTVYTEQSNATKSHVLSQIESKHSSIKLHTDEMLRSGVTRESPIEYVIVIKKKKSVEMCLDVQDLNDRMVKHYVPPNYYFSS